LQTPGDLHNDIFPDAFDMSCIMRLGQLACALFKHHRIIFCCW